MCLAPIRIGLADGVWTLGRTIWCATWQRCSMATTPRSDVFCKVLHTLARWNRALANMLESQSFVKFIRGRVWRVRVHFADNQTLPLRSCEVEHILVKCACSALAPECSVYHDSIHIDEVFVTSSEPEEVNVVVQGSLIKGDQ